MTIQNQLLLLTYSKFLYTSQLYKILLKPTANRNEPVLATKCNDPAQSLQRDTTPTIKKTNQDIAMQIIVLLGPISQLVRSRILNS